MSNYSEDQVLLVRLINSNSFNDCYSILGIHENCRSPEEIRKAYKKLCLRVHPDKNKAPGSEEAFKKVDDAYKKLLQQCLNPSNSSSHFQYSNPRPRPRAAAAAGGVGGGVDMNTVIIVGGLMYLVHQIVLIIGDYPVPMYPGSTQMVPLHSTTIFNLIGIGALKTVQLVTPGIAKTSTVIVHAASTSSGKIIMLSAVGVLVGIFKWCL